MKRILYFLIILIFFVNRSTAQGCSDAGVCTLHSIKNNAEGHETKDGKKNDVSVGFAYGKGERSTNNYTGYVEYTRSLSTRASLTGRISYSAISGELANTSGPGDLFLSFNHAFDIKKKWQKSFVVGLKIPFDGSDIVESGIHLPMPYQTSLGTIDLVLALNYNRKNLGATLALQQPLKSQNENKFLPGDYPSQPLTLNYWPTNQFRRKGDIVARTSYRFKINERFSVRPSLLGIYHIGNDTYEDKNKMRRAIFNSNGLTLNANGFFDFRLKNGSGFELSLGAPFVIRDQRPDGLTRSFVASLEYQFSF